MYMFVQNKIDPINLQRKIMEWARYTHVANLKADTINMMIDLKTLWNQGLELGMK